MIRGMMIKVLAKVLVFYSVMAVPWGCTKFEIITTVINFPEWLLLSEKELNLVPWEINNIVKYFIIVSKIFEEATSNKHWCMVHGMPLTYSNERASFLPPCLPIECMRGLLHVFVARDVALTMTLLTRQWHHRYKRYNTNPRGKDVV